MYVYGMPVRCVVSFDLLWYFTVHLTLFFRVRLCVCSSFLSGDASQNAQSEDNFFEKARRCVLRAIGVGARKSLTGAGVDGVAAVATPFPESADDIEARHKIKVRRNDVFFAYMPCGYMPGNLPEFDLNNVSCLGFVPGPEF